jgi:hypothetical protein
VIILRAYCVANGPGFAPYRSYIRAITQPAKTIHMSQLTVAAQSTNHRGNALECNQLGSASLSPLAIITYAMNRLASQFCTCIHRELLIRQSWFATIHLAVPPARALSPTVAAVERFAVVPATLPFAVN